MYERYVKRGIDFILALIILPFVLFVICLLYTSDAADD